MTKKLLIPYLALNCLSWADFREWIVGQTLSSNDKGETIYYIQDIERFIFTKGVYPEILMD